MRDAPPISNLNHHLRTFLDDQVYHRHTCYDEAYVRSVSRQSFSM
jgi:hypothetical protein